MHEKIQDQESLIRQILIKKEDGQKYLLNLQLSKNPYNENE